MTAIHSTTLHSTKDGADKIYIPAIVPNPKGGFDVIAQNGRRGGTLTLQKPKAQGVDEATAMAAFDALVREKIKGGYRPIDDNPVAVAAASERDGKRGGFPVQLLNPISRTEVAEALLGGFVLQEKHDGERRVIVVRGGDVAGVNRKGEYVPLPPTIADEAKMLARGDDMILDGEIIGDVIHVFDAQMVMGSDVTSLGFLKRQMALDALFSGAAGKAIRLTPVFVGPDAEIQIERLRLDGAEGVVLRNPNAKYSDGRPSKGGHALKFKFYTTGSFEVIRHNDRHSIGVAAHENGQPVDVGNVTLPPSQTPPAIGSIVEVRYLYAYRGGSLYQPTFLGVRSDVDADTVESLSYKGEGAA